MGVTCNFYHVTFDPKLKLHLFLALFSNLLFIFLFLPDSLRLCWYKHTTLFFSTNLTGSRLLSQSNVAQRIVFFDLFTNLNWTSACIHLDERCDTESFAVKGRSYMTLGKRALIARSRRHLSCKFTRKNFYLDSPVTVLGGAFSSIALGRVHTLLMVLYAHLPRGGFEHYRALFLFDLR